MGGNSNNMAPDGSYVGGSSNNMAPDGSYGGLKSNGTKSNASPYNDALL